MSNKLLSPRAQVLEKQWEEPGDNRYKRQLPELAALSPVAQQAPSGTYNLYMVRNHPEAGSEIFGPKTLHLGKYSEADLYGSSSGSPVIAFKSALAALKDQAARIGQLDEDTLECGHQATLFWADVGALKTFIGVSPVITEIVTELRTARFQFLRRDTPPSIFKALETALGLFLDSARWEDPSAVDQFVEILEKAGYDSLVIDALRDSNACRLP